MNNYQCNVCQHIYSPSEGDPLHSVEAGTSFDDLPNDWVCPVCGVGKVSFHEITDSFSSYEGFESVPVKEEVVQ